MGAPKLRDVRKLADSRSVFDLDVALSALPDIPADYVGGSGSVQAHLVFGREQGFPMAQVQLQAQLEVTCQRCLAAMPLRLEAESPILIVESEQEAERAPAGWEVFLAPEGRLSFEALISEELRLALPIVPVHERSAQCQPLAAVAPAQVPGLEQPTAQSAPAAGGASEAQAAAAGTARPFADLRALLDQAAKPRSGRR
ncbi:MAG TPA: DUF177 domain-containing protein [Steroidobacteraceae bacterium]|nr:DUF177 domain-containing protein [Steroidobacteraceae bacterium]